MKGEKIEILKGTPQAKEAGAGEDEAVIRLVGVFELPEKPQFTILPLDDDDGLSEQEGWPQGEQTARKMRVGEKGVEMIVAAEAIDTPALLPGTPVAISVPSASIREELRWPSLAATRTARRGVVVVNAEKRRAQIAARAKARRSELESMAAVRLAAEIEETSGTDADARARASGEALSRLELKRKSAVKLVSSTDGEPALDVPQPGRAPAPGVEQTDPRETAQPASAAASNVTAMPDKAAAMPVPPLPPLPPHTQASPTALMKAAPPPVPPGPKPNDPPLPDFYPSRPQAGPKGPLGSEHPPPLPAQRAVARTTPAGPPDRVPAGLPATAPRFLSSTAAESKTPHTFQRAFGLGFLVAALLAAISTFAFRGDVGGLLSSAAPTTVDVAAAPQPTTLATLSGILAVPEVTPRGENVAALDLGEILKRADQSLAAGDSQKEDAKYWLRRSLALGLGEQRLVWALTQLGTIYAAPVAGSPDFAAARTLWEIAAAQGDPVALCFLASLHEHGLGVAKDPVRALVHYRNAKTHGGCRNVDQAIARLSKGAP